MRVTLPLRFTLLVCLAAAGPLGAQVTRVDAKNKTLARVEPTCWGNEFIFEKSDGGHICIPPGFNVCPPTQVLDRSGLIARCKAGPHPPIACPTGQEPYQDSTGKQRCISAGSNPCPQGQRLYYQAKRDGITTCSGIEVKPPLTCPAGQIVFHGPDGKVFCIASGSNPCPQGQALDIYTGLPSFATCKPLPAKPPFTCPAGQIAFQSSDGKMLCIAPGSNPCPQGQALDKTSASGITTCKGLAAKVLNTCPAGKVRVQQPDGRFVCVTRY